MKLICKENQRKEDMKKQINDLLLKMQNGENSIDETASQLLDLFDVTGCCDCINAEINFTSPPPKIIAKGKIIWDNNCP